MVLGYGWEVANVIHTFLLPVLRTGIRFPTCPVLLPSIIALLRGKRDTLAIFLLNLFLGWSIIGWIVALVWAAKHDAPMVARY